MVNGSLIVNNPTGIASFRDHSNIPITSPEAKALSRNLSRALEYQWNFRQQNIPSYMPELDPQSQSWFEGFFSNEYPNRDITKA